MELNEKSIVHFRTFHNLTLLGLDYVLLLLVEKAAERQIFIKFWPMYAEVRYCVIFALMRGCIRQTWIIGKQFP